MLEKENRRNCKRIAVAQDLRVFLGPGKDSNNIPIFFEGIFEQTSIRGGESHMKKEFTYETIKELELLPVDTSVNVVINGLVLFDVEEITVHEMDHEYVLLRVLASEGREVGQITIYPGQKLSVTGFGIKFDY